MLQPFDILLQATTGTGLVDRDVPLALAAPIVTSLVAALVYQTRRLTKMSDRTEQIVDELLQELLARKIDERSRATAAERRRRRAAGGNSD